LCDIGAAQGMTQEGVVCLLNLKGNYYVTRTHNNKSRIQ